MNKILYELKMVVNFKGFKILLIILIYRDTHEVLSEPRSGVVNSSKKNLSKFPSIYLKSFTEEDSWIQHNATADFQNSDVFENSFVVKNGSDYIIHSDIREVRFACVADYPVMWHIPYPEVNRNSFTRYFNSSMISCITLSFSFSKYSSFPVQSITIFMLFPQGIPRLKMGYQSQRMSGLKPNFYWMLHYNDRPHHKVVI